MKLSIVVPAYNESKNLKLLIPQLDTTLSTLNQEYEIIIVDNASIDDTQETLSILKSRFPRIVGIFEEKKRFGNAILAGLGHARGEVIGYIHADNQMEAMDIVHIYQKLCQENLDLCKATRMDRHDGVVRWIISKVYNFLFRIMFNVRLLDINGSPKLFTRKFFEQANISSRDWFIDPEIIIKAGRMRVLMGEVEIHTNPREYGSSQVRAVTVLEFLKNMFHYWRNG
ncbi:MAG: glycosyltransferase family 2 protein [Candidatus Zapsychrus exili]|nr:glycosyltransferase family 2 protein [Candidatus Zapsychrus exili]